MKNTTLMIHNEEVTFTPEELDEFLSQAVFKALIMGYADLAAERMEKYAHFSDFTTESMTDWVVTCIDECTPVQALEVEEWGKD